MYPKTRRRADCDPDASEGVVWLVVLVGPAVYAKFAAIDWHWRVMLGVFVATAVVLGIRAFRRAAATRRRERLMVDDARRLTWRDFESYVQVLLQDLGWEHVQHTGGAGDGGVDLRGLSNGEQWIVQCKHRSTDRKPLQPGIARDLLGTLSEEGKRGRANRALLVTTGRFGPDSRKLERATRSSSGTVLSWPAGDSRPTLYGRGPYSATAELPAGCGPVSHSSTAWWPCGPLLRSSYRFTSVSNSHRAIERAPLPAQEITLNGFFTPPEGATR